MVSSCDKLPDDTIVQQVPAYYTESGYLDGRVEVINQAIEDAVEPETFFWITDIHWELDLNERHSPALIKYIAERTGVSKVLNGGDTGNSNVICGNAIGRLRDAIGSNEVYSVNGNHEINDASRYEEPFQRVCKTLRGHNDNLVYGDSNRSYFYWNQETDKTRFIGLSTYGLYINGRYASAYTSEQLRWFTEDALNVEEGWTIVIFAHALYIADPYTNELSLLSSSFANAIDNYKGKGNIACVLMGDSHVDRIHIGPTGVPYIISQCDRTEPYKGDINVDRVPGTISEQHFEVVVLDKKRQEVKLFAIGSDARDGIDDERGKQVEERTVNYGGL